MNFNRKDAELTAPVGSYESLMAAIQGGADSIYFGVENLNMRSRSANNFTRDDLPKIVQIARENNIKANLTLNTVVYNHEINEIRRIIDLAKESGINAIIASDQAVIDYAYRSGVELHLSTQLNISNIDSIRFYSGFADVMVLARELDLKQVAEIAHGIEMEEINGPSGKRVKLEMFVHGALCMSVSGKCYLSLHEYNHSANRGDCFQVCRRSYIVTDKETGRELEVDNQYIMSPKDLMTIHFLDDIIKSGVTVLKIEGRARSPEYVYTVASCYNEAIISIADESYNHEKIENWKDRLSQVFNRGFWDGYYLGQRLGEWSEAYGSRATQKKIYIGKGTNYYDRIGVAEFLIEADELSVGDEILITGPTTGVVRATVEEIRIDLKNEKTARKGDRISIPVKTLIRRSDKMYKLLNNSEDEPGSR